MKANDRTTKMWIFAWLGLTLLLFLAVAQWSNKPSVPIEGATAVLTLIGAVAVGIERAIEAGWDGVKLFRGQSWAKAALGRIDSFTRDLDKEMKPFQAEFDKALAAINEKYARAPEELAAAKEKLDELQKKLTEFQTMAPNMQAFSLATSGTNKIITELQDKYPEAVKVCGIGQEMLATTTDFWASFKDNPGKRLISLMVGMFLGLCITGPLGLDLFLAALGTTLPDSTILPHAGVAITGLVIGLGSGPTHTLIRTLEEFKIKSQANNA